MTAAASSAPPAAHRPVRGYPMLSLLMNPSPADTRTDAAAHDDVAQTLRSHA